MSNRRDQEMGRENEGMAIREDQCSSTVQPRPINQTLYQITNHSPPKSVLTHSRRLQRPLHHLALSNLHGLRDMKQLAKVSDILVVVNVNGPWPECGGVTFYFHWECSGSPAWAWGTGGWGGSLVGVEVGDMQRARIGCWIS